MGVWSVHYCILLCVCHIFCLLLCCLHTKKSINACCFALPCLAFVYFKRVLCCFVVHDVRLLLLNMCFMLLLGMLASEVVLLCMWCIAQCCGVLCSVVVYCV